MSEEGAVLSEQTLPACDNGDCKAVDGQRQCVCKDGFIPFDGSCKPEGIYDLFSCAIKLSIKIVSVFH